MGRRGPAPTPGKILQARGSWRGKTPRSPKAPRGVPPMPAWLDKKAKTIWRNLIPLLDELGLLCRVDGGALARYCAAFSQWRDAYKSIQEEGQTIESEEGEIKVHPAVRIFKELAAELTRTEDRFGLSPSARTKLILDAESILEPKTPGRKAKDAFDKSALFSSA